MAHAEKRWSKKDKRFYWRVKYRLPDGSYGSASRDADNNRFTTERSAEKYGQALETDIDRKVFVNPRDGNITVGGWAEMWIESIEVGPLSERDYRSRLRAVILPRWNDVAMRRVTAIAYMTWEKELRAEGRKPNSIRGIRAVFRTMMEDAVKSNVIGSNPVPIQKGTRRGKYQPRKTEEEKIFADARQALMVAHNGLHLRGFGLYVMVLTSFYTGLRIGELAGLQRSRLVLPIRRKKESPEPTPFFDGFITPHVDRWAQPARGSRILLESQTQYVDGKPTLIPAKYESGRPLIIPPFLAELLLQLIASHKSEFVFLAPKGGRLLIGGDWYTDTWHPIVDGRAPIPSSRGHKARPGIRPVLGVTGMVPHGLRHGHRVSLDEAGHPRVAIEERMGHEVPGVEGTYSHTTLTMEKRISDSLQALWENSLRPAPGRKDYEAVPSPENTDLKMISQKSPK
ncbi:tyrosine-type recombinase/integrase [Streptomyces sp. NPDC050509]|uniref:tyrosine-type recombinase/integrase n=1 Tax=Streptomyces sp. NPDC050509 TaxID=3365620 RepID=UPI0037941535